MMAILVLFLVWNRAGSAPLVLGLGLDPVEGRFVGEEWTWALRGGGAEFRWLSLDELAALPAEIPLLILDSIPLNSAARRGLEAWVWQGGLLIYAGVPTALEEVGDDGQIRPRREVVAAELLGVRVGGSDPGLPETYPDITVASALLSPLRPGDALRLGTAGVAHTWVLEPAGAEVLAQSAQLNPGPGGLVLKSGSPTIFTRKHGHGRVVFLSFSPGRVAACYPDFRQSRSPRDCSGAGSAHALMRWMAANLLWEEKRLQLPLLWEVPGDLLHGFIVTGDVHDHPTGWEVKAAVRMAELLDRLGLPLSYYLMGKLAETAPLELEALRRFRNLEIGTHSLDGKVYTQKKFGLWGFGETGGILSDIRQAEAQLRIPAYPKGRTWLLSTRSHGWLSDPGAWDAMRRAGIGLVFDQVADRLQQPAPWRVPAAWFTDDERRRLFVPLYERCVSSSAGNFRLTEEQQKDMALLASGQPDPYDDPVPYRVYSDHVLRWHGVFDRLATVGGLTEVWLWHPGGIAGRASLEDRPAFDELERTLEIVRGNPSVLFLRGDVAANWRANRESYRIRPVRDAAGALQQLELLPPTDPPLPLPPEAPAVAASTSYWVIGPARIPGWTARAWTDPAGRTITVLVRPLASTSP